MKMIKDWKDAVTFAQIGELNAQFIEGTRKNHSSYLAKTVAEETYPLRKVLAKYNRNGFVTQISQPGKLCKGGGQRAAVYGYALEAVAKQINTLTLHSELIVLIYSPGKQGGYQIPITVESYHACTWLGLCRGEEAFQHFDKLNIGGQMAMRDAWQVYVIDPKWGRKPYLWKHVSQALAGQISPFSADHVNE
jgi:hypothetical protein